MLQLVQLMTIGTTEGSGPMSLQEVAVEMGIKIDTAARYFSDPRARTVYMQLLRTLREGEFAKNTA
ncbi:MAG TPA: hypothetical protein VMP03_07750, partial [Methylomirabilota bacterium]|nr:hypothetical protein [Methylomirabilota bacterium]